MEQVCIKCGKPFKYVKVTKVGDNKMVIKYYCEEHAPIGSNPAVPVKR
jgi:hypothetical protein